MGPTGHLVTIKRSGVDGPHFPLSLSTCLFGRGIECDIRIQLPVVSKQHCKIEVNEQKAILFNFSSTNPTQVNGSAIDKPVQLKHGDVITIVDRSFRYENESHQNGSTSTEFPGQRREQASPRRVSMSGFSSNPDGKVQDPKTCAKLTEESVLGRRLVHVGEVRAARPVSRASEEPVARETPRVHPSDLSQDDGRKAADPAAGDAQEVSRVTPLSRNGELKPFPSTQCLENSEESESPFRKLYESMKEELDMRPEKENVLRSRRKSASRSHCAAENESADGLQGETPRLVSPKSRRTSGRGSQGTADPSASGAQGSGQMGKTTGEGPAQTPKVTLSPSGPPMEARKTGTPRRRSQQSSTPTRRSGDLRAIDGDEPENLDGSGGFKADRRARLPRESLTRNQTPTKPEDADNFGNTPGKVSSKKRRRSSVPADADVLNTEAEIQKQTAFAPLLLQKERKMPDGALSTSGPLGAPAGQRCPGSPGLRSVDVSNVGDSTNMIEGMPLKRRRVSFGGHLRPELFDENLPPNTPVKRGETPMRRRSLVTHTATTVLKKIIKEQSQPPGQEDPSEIHLGVTAQNVFLSSPARNPVKTPAATDKRRRSSEPSSASSGGAFPQQTDTPKREGRRSSSGPSKRMSVDRSQQEILQMIQSKRRSGASEANLIVAKSWADVVKLSAKQTQTKVIKHGPRRQLNKRQKRVNTPKKPTGSVHNQFSTGHANSPCTIVVGKAHIEKVNVPARPYRMLNNFMFNKKIDFNEDLSGLTEMFKTPAKEKPQAMSICPISFSNSEDFHRKKFQVLKSEEKPLLCTPENFGDDVFPSTQNAPKQTSYKSSASPALKLHCFAVKENRKTLPSEAEPPKVASNTNKFRRSMELRNTQVPGADCENKDAEANTTENILGRHRRKTQQEEKLKEEMKENERTFETCNKNIESKENSEKMIAAKRSRRSSELKCAQRADLITPKRLQQTEPKEDLVDTHSLFGTPGHAKEPVDVENRTTVKHCKSPEPDRVSTPAKMNACIKTPSQKVNVDELSALRKSTQTPEETTHSHREAVGDDKITEFFKETPEQILDAVENVTGSRRRSRTPKRKVQPLQDLAGFKELFQTPNRTVEPVTDNKTTKIPHKSLKPEPVNSPGGDNDIRAFKETPEQKVDPIENVTGSRRGSRTPKRKVQPLQDLAGFRELFQTPNCTVEPVNNDKTFKITHKSPKPEPVNTSGDDKNIRAFTETPEQKLDPAENGTGSRRGSRTPKRKVQLTEDLAGLKELLAGEVELSALGKSTRTPGGTMGSPREAVGDDRIIELFKETPQQKLDPTENVTGSRRGSRTPKRKVQSLQDLAGLKELFQTPNHTVEPVTDDKTTKIPHKSPKPEPGNKPGDDKNIRAFKETPEQKVDPTENVTGSRRRSRTPKRKVQPLQDLVGFKELFQTPNRTVEPVTDDKTTKIPHKSPEPEPVNSPGGDNDIRAFKETPEQKVDPTENVTGSRRRPRTPKRKVQLTEDLAGLKELFQTPNRTVEPVTDDKATKIPRKSPKPEPVNTPTSTKHRLQTPQGKVDGEEDLSALRNPTQTPGETTDSHGEPVGDVKDIKAFMETPEENLDSAENVTESRKRPRTPKKKVQPVEDLAGLKELFQTPNHTVEPVTDDKTKIPCKSPQAEAGMPTGRRSCPEALPEKADVAMGPLALRKPTRASRKTTHSHRQPVDDDKDITVFKENAVQKQDPAKNVARSKRKPRTAKEKTQPIEDLTGLTEILQASDHTDEPVTVVKTTRMCRQSPQPGPGILPSSKKRRLKAPAGKADWEEQPSVLRKSARTGRSTRAHRELEEDDKDVTMFKETVEQKLDPAKNVARSKRKPTTAKEKTQPIEDLTGLTELLQAPDHTDEPVTVVKTTRMRRQSPQPGPGILPSSKKRRLKAPAGKADGEEQPSVLRKSARTGRSTRAHGEPEEDKDVTVSQDSAVQKPDPAKNVARSMRKPRTAKEKIQPIEDVTGLTELLQAPDHTDEPVTVVKTTRMRRQQSPQPGPGILPSSKKRQLKAPAGKADGEEQPLVLRKSARTGRSTRAHGEPVDGHKNVIVCEGAAKPKLGPADNTTGSKRLLRAGKGKAPALEGPAGCKELLQTADPDKDQGNDAESIKRTPMQRPDRREPVRTSRRVLRAPHVKPMDDLTGSRDPVKSQSKSSVSRSPKRKRGKDGTVPGGKRLRSTMCPQDTALETPLQKRQGTAPRESCEPPEPLITKKKSQRVLAGRIESVEDLPSNSVRTKNKGQQAEAVTSPEKGRSLRYRHPNKTSAAERSPEFLESAEKIKVKRNEKKAPNTSREVKLQTLEDGAKNSASGGQVHERRTCLRSGRQSTKPLPDATEEKAREKSVETHVVKKTQEEKEGPKRSGSTCLRSRKKTVPPTGDTLEKESKQKVTRSTKRSAENVKKEDDDVCIKKLRSRRH
ncbi:PREDICTED: proliferation marker protein Ki-67 [Hipposideros armiger]|uniref:Proliferation marker protein Ki-67 n=1 Tax=Hipposideros armiger TaxID=186990 RepID=A0A8B7RHC3_HIPAR|nr:PREDICTED: proliferation marker protein Ki-67 [Hipposideros armiger]